MSSLQQVAGPPDGPAGDADRRSARGARVVPVPPPLYYGAAFAAGLALRRLGVPLDIGARPAVSVVGFIAVAGGAALSLTGVATVVRHDTTVVPHHPVSELVTSGVYRLSRNPMYTGLAVAYVGGMLLTGTWWPLVTLVPALLLVRRLVIDPEERYLTARFGAAYAEYRRRVRRWL